MFYDTTLAFLKSGILNLSQIMADFFFQSSPITPPKNALILELISFQRWWQSAGTLLDLNEAARAKMLLTPAVKSSRKCFFF